MSAAPSMLRKRSTRRHRTRDRHAAALESIREFLKGRSCYDGLPVSFRLIVLDTKLIVKPALDVMWQAGVVSAPLWHSSPLTDTVAPSLASDAASDSEPPPSMSSSMPLPELDTSPAPAEALTHPSSHGPDSAASSLKPRQPLKPGFAGMLTVNDIIHLIQYYYRHSSYDNAAQDVERFRLEMLRDIERALGVPQPPLLSVSPLRPLYEACQLLIKTHARRLPLLDYDEQTGIETVLSVLTQYRVLKFIAMNCPETAGLQRSVKSLGIGTYVAGTKGVGVARASKSSATSSQGGSESAQEPQASATAPAVLAEGEAQQPREGSTDATDAAASGPSAAAAGAGSADSGAPPPPPLAQPPPTGASPPPPLPPPPRDPYEPIYTATLDTTVFDVVHVFSERGISAVPVLDDEGYAVDMYETVDIIDLVRSGAYQSLDLTIRQALARRPADFAGVMACSPDDSLASIFSLLRTRRVHRLLVLEPDDQEPTQGADTSAVADQGASRLGSGGGGGEMGTATTATTATTTTTTTKWPSRDLEAEANGDARYPPRGRGRLVGILCLSDILKYLIGSMEEKEEREEQEKRRRSRGRWQGEPPPLLPPRATSGTRGTAAGGRASPRRTSEIDVAGGAGAEGEAGADIAIGATGAQADAGARLGVGELMVALDGVAAAAAAAPATEAGAKTGPAAATKEGGGGSDGVDADADAEDDVETPGGAAMATAEENGAGETQSSHAEAAKADGDAAAG